jgi:pyruvate, orthophosphate dikinase
MTKMDPDNLVACLRVKGFGKAETLSEALDKPTAAIEAVMADLIANGLAEQTRAGVRLSATGRTLAAELLTREREGLDLKRLEKEYERFVPLNSEFKALVTDWQIRQVGGKTERNDHSDEAYDAEILARLSSLDNAISALIDDIASLAPRTAAYRRRLASALKRIESGDHRYVTAPDRDSYHTVWFELHQDLIGLLGTTREKEAAAGRAV